MCHPLEWQLADAAHDAGRRDALVDPLDGGRNWVFPHHDPPNVVGVRLQPHRSQTFKLSSDALFVDKMRDIVGLYLSPPNRALVLSIDEKSQIHGADADMVAAIVQVLKARR